MELLSLEGLNSNLIYTLLFLMRSYYTYNIYRYNSQTNYVIDVLLPTFAEHLCIFVRIVYSMNREVKPVRKIK